MLMTAILNIPTPRKSDFSAYSVYQPVSFFNHEGIPLKTPEPDIPPCSIANLPPSSSDDVPPLGLRLEALVQAHRPVAAAITNIRNLNHIRYALHWETGDAVRDTIAELVATHSGDDSWTMAYDSAEFLTIMPNCTLAEATTRAHAWEEAIESYPWKNVHPALNVNVVVGVVAQEPLSDYEKLLADADVALRCSLS
jgi:GGDEF domain-containing protein